MPKPRVLVLTDMTSIRAGEREPDDAQSMIRLLLYSNDLDLEGFVASSNLRHGQEIRPELIHELINTYGKVLPMLRKHDAAYPAAEHLHTLVKSGQPIAAPNLPVEASVGDGKDTEASAWIIRRADESDNRPLYILAWGGTADLAQALWRIRQDRTPEQVTAFCRRLRIHAINNQDQTATWIKDNFQGLWYATRTLGIRGMYRGGDTSLVRSAWVHRHIHGHGALGESYPDYKGGDIWSGRLGRVSGIKEGDTPSLLAMLTSTGLNDPSRPELGGWGGRSLPDSVSNRYVDAIDLPTNPNAPDPRMSSVYRWRPAFQADFQARLDWCIFPPGSANHRPSTDQPAIRQIQARPGHLVQLKSSRWRDPDGHSVEVRWEVYPPNPAVQLPAETGQTPSLRAPQQPGTYWLIEAATDNGVPALTSYRRVELIVK
ncbi:DUF1593 domain-containing protein [Nibrella saemangeumensis]|uniref:DUF1593 domain-containing protein n=1 Tax=Nibrella saemangeumensis TaxID=1084526 RepID=A0ABP8MFP3_9BACT